MCTYTTATIVHDDCLRNPQHRIVKRLCKRCADRRAPGPRWGLAGFVEIQAPQLAARFTKIMTSTKASQAILRSPNLPFAVDFSSLEFLSPGTSGAIYAIDSGKVLKEYYDQDGGTVERQAFARLGSHPSIIGYLGETESKSIILERGKPLSALGRTAFGSIKTKMAWIRDAAEGLRHMHQQGIVHADLGCENMVLVDGRLKIIDFEGCSIDGEEPSAGYKWYNRQGFVINSQSDIFAYGCVIYQVITGNPPYHEFVAFEDRSNIVRRLYAEHQFPEVRGLPLGDLMVGCWSGRFQSMSEVITALDAIPRLPPDTPPATPVNYRLVLNWVVSVMKYLVLK